MLAILMASGLCAAVEAAEEDAAVRASLRGNAPAGTWETYTRRPSGLLFQQLSLRAAGARETYPGLDSVNAAVEAVLRGHGLLPEGDYAPGQVPALESGAWARLTEEELQPAKDALVAYYRRPAVRDGRGESKGDGAVAAEALEMLKERYPQRRDEWENLSYWTIHTHMLPAMMARGFLATGDPELRDRFAREFRDWMVAYASYPHYTIDIPDGSGLAGWPWIWGDQWHMERTTHILPAFFTFLAPEAAPVLAEPLPQYGGERFDFWFLKLAMDQVAKADGLAAGYRAGNHGWFQVLAASVASVLLPEFQVSDRMLGNALRRAVEHCLDDNRLDGWHRESTLGYMDTYIGYESAVLQWLDQHPQAIRDWSARTGVDPAPFVRTIRETLERQRRASRAILLPDYSVPNYGDGGPGRAGLPEHPPAFRSNCLEGAGVTIFRSGWEGSADGKAHVGISLNAMDELRAHNCSDLLSILLYAYGSRLLAKTAVYRYENSDHWFKRCSQSANTILPGDFADDAQAPESFGAAEMYGPDGTSWGPWPSNTAEKRFDQSGAGPTIGWRGAATHCARVVAWARGTQADFVDAFHDRYVHAPESPWPTGERPFGPRMRRSLFFIHSRAGGVGPYALVTDLFTNPGPEPLAGAYYDLNALYHLAVAPDWREKGVPWQVDARTKALRTTYPEGANLSIVPVDPGKVAVRQVKGLWSDTWRGPGDPPGASFERNYSYIAPYVAYALPGSPAPVPSAMQSVLYPDPPGHRTALRVRRVAVSPAASITQAAAVEVGFPDLGVRDLILVCGAPGVRRRFGGVTADGAVAWIRLKGDTVLAATLVDGTTLKRGSFALEGARLQGTVRRAEPQFHEGFVVNRLGLAGAPLPRTAEGSLMVLRDAGGRFVTSYHVLSVPAPNTVVLSEARRKSSWVPIQRADPAAGGFVLGRDGDDLSPGQPFQVLHQGRSHVFRVAAVQGRAVRVTAPDGSAPDLSSFAGPMVPGTSHAYETIPEGCRYQVCSIASWSEEDGDV